MALELRPNCECCDRDLAPDNRDAMICSFECTFCVDCVTGVLDGACPNCGGEPGSQARSSGGQAHQQPGIDEAGAESGRLRGSHGRVRKTRGAP